MLMYVYIYLYIFLYEKFFPGYFIFLIFFIIVDNIAFKIYSFHSLFILNIVNNI